MVAKADTTTGDVASLKLYLEGDIVLPIFDKRNYDDMYEEQVREVPPEHNIVGVYGRAKPNSVIESLGFVSAKFIGGA